jgi:Flp pilus assembly pilin Flp
MTAFRNAMDLLVDDGGATLVEYALVLALFSTAMIAALASIGTSSTAALQHQSDGFVTLQTTP